MINKKKAMANFTIDRTQLSTIHATATMRVVIIIISTIITMDITIIIITTVSVLITLLSRTALKNPNQMRIFHRLIIVLARVTNRITIFKTKKLNVFRVQSKTIRNYSKMKYQIF